MIYVSQGFEAGIGLEIFIKSWLCLSENEQFEIMLSTDPYDFQSNLELMNLNYKFVDDGCYINNQFLKCLFFENSNFGNTTNSLNSILGIISKEDILVTLPSRKSEFYLNNKNLNGHTEFFRKYYSNNEICMCFKGPSFNVLLLTDHIPVSKIHSSINYKKSKNKINIALNGFEKYFSRPSEILFSGINPHCGENGLIGSEDRIINQLVNNFETSKGPFAGDMLHLNINNKNQLFIYTYHDQGLAPFKLKHGLIGANITFGLPFLRLSVDHGTAEDLFGLGLGNSSSQLYILNMALEINQKKGPHKRTSL